VPFTLVSHAYASLDTTIAYYEDTQDWARWYYLQRLAATANGRYSFRQPNLNDAVDVRPIRFQDWLQQVWGPA